MRDCLDEAPDCMFDVGVASWGVYQRERTVCVPGAAPHMKVVQIRGHTHLSKKKKKKKRRTTQGIL